MDIRDLRVQAYLCLELKAASRDEALHELVWLCFKKGHVKSPDDILKRLIQREAFASTSLGNGFAIPHARLPYIDNSLLTIGRSSKGIAYTPTDPHMIHLIFLLLSPEGEDPGHLHMLARIVRLLKDAAFTSELMAAATEKDFSRALEKQNIEVL